uniref:Bm10348, isoform a n=1 Tax=Brugia malayi TaxID=6279 RepID=A0A1I9G3E9_BRUMA|nr:Bm10348, isoform a [Brugia malayi]
MYKTNGDKWITRSDRDIVPVSTVQGYVQKGFFYKCLLKDISKDVDDFGLLHKPTRMALATRIQMSNLPPLLLPAVAEEYVRARISYVADSNRLFVQLENNARTIIKINEAVRNLAKQKHKPLCNPECGTVIAALYSPDRSYYRASVCSKAGIDSVLVFYIDYGNMASIDINDAFVLEDAYLLSIPPQAVQLIIEDVTRPRLTLEQIKNLLTDQTADAQINSVSGNGESFVAKLFVKDEKNRIVNLTEVILGERPAPTLPIPKPVNTDSFWSAKNESVEYTCQNKNWKRAYESNCKAGNFSNNFRSNSGPNFNDYSGENAARTGDRTYRNYGEAGQYSTYRRSGFAKDERDNERFMRSSNYTGSSRSSSSRTKGRNGDTSFRSGFAESRGKIDDTSADESGWKSGDWVMASDTNVAKNELECFLNDDFKKKVHTKKNMQNWSVNEGAWEVNNASCKLVNNGDQIEISKNATVNSGHDVFIDAGNCKSADSYTESAESSEISPTNASEVAVSFDLKVGAEEADGAKTIANKDLSNNKKELSSVVLNRIEPSNLDEIKFGDTVDGLLSDNLEEPDPLSFFVQLNRDKNNIEHLMLSDTELPVNLPNLSSFEISQACVALFMGDYYRAEIIGEENNKKKILFVDYGNVEYMDASMLYVINNSLPQQFYTSRRMAFHCRLHGVMPVAYKHTFDPDARRLFSELIADQKLLICFLQQSVKGIYEVTIMLSNGRIVSDILISRGFAVPFKWGIGPSFPLYETLHILRSDEFDHVHPVFTVQLSDSLSQLERLNNEYVDSKKIMEAPQIGDVVISYFEESPYRAEIIAIEIDNGNTVYRVHYVDYGNESICSKEELFELDRDQQPDEIIYTPRQGFRCLIDGVRPLNCKAEWSEEVQKCIDNLLAPSASFEAVAGSPSVDGVYPIRIMVLKNQLNEESDIGNGETDDANDKVELASWLISKGYAEMQNIWRDYPVKNLLSDGEHEYEMFITEVDGQIIRARPYALANIEAVPLLSDAATGLISLNNENKRAMLISSTNNETSTKYLLVDEGISIERTSIQFSGTDKLCDSDGFLVRTCHRLSVQLRLTDILLDKKSKEMIMSSATSGPAKVILVEYSGDNCYQITDILFSDGTTLLEKLKETIVEKESPDLVTSNFEEAGRSLNEDKKAADSRLLINEAERIECGEILIANEDPNWTPEPSEMSNGIFDGMHEEGRTIEPEIISFLNSLLARF